MLKNSLLTNQKGNPKPSMLPSQPLKPPYPNTHIKENPITNPKNSTWKNPNSSKESAAKPKTNSSASSVQKESNANNPSGLAGSASFLFI